MGESERNKKSQKSRVYLIKDNNNIIKKKLSQSARGIQDDFKALKLEQQQKKHLLFY